MTPKHPSSILAIALPLRRLALVATAVAALLGPGSSALARQAGGPLADIIDHAQMSPADLQAIKAYTAPRVQGLGSPDASTRSSARRELMAVFMGGTSPSVSFRIAFGDEVMGVLRQQAGGQDEAAAVGALRLAGELATTQAEQLLAQGLGDQRNAVRYAAASGYGELFRAMSESKAAIPGNQQGPLFEKVAAAMATEENILVVDAFLRAFNETSVNAQMRVTAMRLAMDALSAQLQSRRRDGDAAPLQTAQTALRGVAMAQEMIIDLGAGIPQDTALAAARLTGQSMAFAMSAIDGEGGLGALTGAALDTYSALLRASETTAALSNVSVNGQSPTTGQPIDRALTQGNEGALQTAVDGWIGASGVLVRSPHTNKAADFD